MQKIFRAQESEEMSSVSHLLGTEVTVRTTTGETYKGELFWYVTSDHILYYALVMTSPSPIASFSKKKHLKAR